MGQGRRLGDLTGSFVQRIDPKGKRFTARAVEAWTKVAGPEIRKHTKGLALREGELVVSVDSPSWATELSLLSERLREEINTVLGEELVRTIRFDVSKRVAREAAWERRLREEEETAERDKVRPVALSDIERRQVDFCATPIADDQLREAAVRAMTKDLEWKKALKLRNEAQARSEGPETGRSTAE